MRVLLTDILFPNAFAKWRLVEIQSFINTYDTDIMVIHRTNDFAGIHFTLDYEKLDKSLGLSENYDILIFNPMYNELNNYNPPDFDGSSFNTDDPVTRPCDYLFQKRQYRDVFFYSGDGVNLDMYAKIYHIFLMNYRYFQSLFPHFPPDRQFIHLYPGGCFSCADDILSIHPETRVICTQHFITSMFADRFPEKPLSMILNAYGATYFCKGEAITHRKNYKSKEDPLCVCFTSMGVGKEKGADDYLQIVDQYTTLYGETVYFISIGTCPPHPHVTHYNAMTQHDLSLFYQTHVDVILNLETGFGFHGFPLGVEAAVEGCLLLTTDVRDSNQGNGFNLDSFLILETPIVEQAIEKIRYLDLNREILQTKSIALQDRLFDLFCYDHMMHRILIFVENV